MENMLKYKNYMIAAGILLLILIAYFAFGKNSDQEKPEVPECPNSFTLHPVGALAGFVSTAYSIVDGKYFKQISGEAMGASGQLPPKEITKDEFLAACKTYKIPTV